jgi:hypothetical protein
MFCDGKSYLRPTAAFFISERHIKKRATSIARAEISIDPRVGQTGVSSRAGCSRRELPKLARTFPPPNVMPINSQPPKPAADGPTRAGDSLKSCIRPLKSVSVVANKESYAGAAAASMPRASRQDAGYGRDQLGGKDVHYTLRINIKSAYRLGDNVSKQDRATDLEWWRICCQSRGRSHGTCRIATAFSPAPQRSRSAGRNCVD